MHNDRPALRLNGWAALLVILGLLGCSIAVFISALVSFEADKDSYRRAQPAAEVSFDGKPARNPVSAPLPVRPDPVRLAFPLVTATLVFVMALWLLRGLVIVQPNDGRVLVLFGRYAGSLLAEGFHWVNFLAARQAVSLRIHNHEVKPIKVNDVRGTPIEIGAIVVYRVRDAARAVLDVQSWPSFIASQCDAALRSLANAYPYDPHQADEPSLRGTPEAVLARLAHELASRVEVAGVEIIEARISHLAYAPEIAQAMLRRQQAEAVVSARAVIVEGAVGLVEQALHGLTQRGVTLDEERKAAMVNNLLVALVSEQASQPVLNVSSLYH